jgi:hypothetical protein
MRRAYETDVWQECEENRGEIRERDKGMKRVKERKRLGEV